MGVCKARESVKTTEKGIQGKDEDHCDQGLDGHGYGCPLFPAVMAGLRCLGEARREALEP